MNPTTATKPTLLITGGSGVLGRALIDELSPDFTLICLRHRAPLDDPRVLELTADLSSPTLGLRRSDYARLTTRVAAVVHAAAATSWKADPAHIRATNIDGTRSMLELAGRAEAPMILVSTAFVANPPPATGDRFAAARSYIRSKIECEDLTRASDVSTSIVRPSVIIGSSVDGRMSAFQGLHRVAGLIARGHVPLIACDGDSLTDTIPVDLVATAIADVLRRGDHGDELWLTAGASALTARDILEVAVALGQRAGLDPHFPRFIPAEAVDRLLVPLLTDAITPQLRRMFAELLELTWLFQAPAALPSSMAQLGLAAEITRDQLRDTFAKSMDYWARTKGLLPAVTEDSSLDSYGELAS